MALDLPDKHIIVHTHTHTHTQGLDWNWFRCDILVLNIEAILVLNII